MSLSTDEVCDTLPKLFRRGEIQTCSRIDQKQVWAVDLEALQPVVHGNPWSVRAV